MGARDRQWRNLVLMNTKAQRICRYRFAVDVSQGIVGRITLWSDGSQPIGEIVGLETGQHLPPPRIAGDLSHATTFVGADALPALVDVLRHEKDVFMCIDNAPPGFVTIKAGMVEMQVGSR